MENNNKRSRVVRENNHQDEDEDEAEAKRPELNSSNNSIIVSNSRMRPWHHPSSRIYRVSRASGGKDRHSKVYTSKGLRDRRIRLSVSTAIQFYDLQDRLRYDQPSKAIEWLIKAAQSAIDELPSLDTIFPMDQNLNVEDHPMVSDSVMDPDAEPSYDNNNNQQQHSSTSETSKGSVLSLSRSEIRVKARERARERVKDKEKDRDDVHMGDPSLNAQGSFTKLLTGGSSAGDGVGQASLSADFIQKQQMQQHNLPPVCTTTADFFNTQTGFSSQTHFGMVPLLSSNGGGGGDHSNEMQQQFAFMQDHFLPVAVSQAEGDYSLNFSISPGFAGFHRGTLQSNSPSHHHHHHQLQLSHHHHHLLSHHHNQNSHHQVQAQRLSLALDGSSMPVPLFFGTTANAAAAAPNENPYSSGFDGHLQLDAYKNLELKGKGKG